MEIFEKYITFPSSDGENTISAQEIYPLNPVCVLQITHGMAEYKERYRDFAHYLAENGIAVCMHDHNGHGMSVKSSEDFGYVKPDKPSEYLIGDMHKLKDLVSAEFSGVPYIMLGHSMGSYLLRKYLAVYSVTEEKVCDGAIIMGTGDSPKAGAAVGAALCRLLAVFKGWHFRSSFIQNLTYNKSYDGYDLSFTDEKNSWLTKDEGLAKKYNDDEKCGFLFTLAGHRGLFEAVEGAGDEKKMKNISAALPMLFISGDCDPVGDNGKGVKNASEKYVKAGIKDVTLKLFENDRHEILNESDRTDVYKYILDWINAKIK